MMTIQPMTFNHIQTNTFVLSDSDTLESIVIDPAFSEEAEQQYFDDYIKKNGLALREALFTHPHPDHLVGGKYIEETYGLIPRINSLSRQLIEELVPQACMIGFENFTLCDLNYDLEDGEAVTFGHYSLKVIYLPGHAEGSVCLYCEKEKVLFSGDALFRSSIGRTDFPTGDYDLLIKNIKEKIFTLPEDVYIFPGHGDRTSVKFEKRFNPFFR
ncbi:MAG: MBL fold metallo-hydrolase [Bacteroidales bacterium]|nr:MBL fold metallo-hydrolase [Bacteroidales bacterium]